MNNQLLQVKTQVAASIADEKQLYQRYQDNDAKAADWQQRAELAVEKGQDDLAREALARRNAFRQTADGFKEQYEQQAAQVETLKTALHQLEVQDPGSADQAEHLLIARARRAKAETQIRTTLSGLDQIERAGQLRSASRRRSARQEATRRGAGRAGHRHDGSSLPADGAGGRSRQVSWPR